MILFFSIHACKITCVKYFTCVKYSRGFLDKPRNCVFRDFDKMKVFISSQCIIPIPIIIQNTKDASPIIIFVAVIGR